MVKDVKDVKEKRNWVRAKRVLSLEYRLVKSKNKKSDNVWHLSTTQDMSLGGLSFYTDKELHIDDVLEVRVKMSGILDIFQGQAKVVRIERKKAAVFFLTAIEFLKQMGGLSRNQHRSVAPKKRNAKRI